MSKKIAKNRLMNRIGEVDEKYVQEAQYTEKELKNLKPDKVSSALAEAEQIAGEITAEEPAITPVVNTDPEIEQEFLPTKNNKIITIVRIAVSVSLVAAAILLFVFLWNPNRSQVATTTDATEAPTETEAEPDTTQEITEATTEAPTTAVAGVRIDEEHFPDPNFRAFITKHFDTNRDNALDELEIQNAKEIFFYTDEDDGTGSSWVNTLDGIEYFTALEVLHCADNKLTALDVTKNTALKTLDISGNAITELDLSQNKALEILDCSQNDIREVDVSSNTSLETLRCSGNPLEVLNVGPLPEKESFFCDVDTWHLEK